jgi:hypothetical protein
MIKNSEIQLGNFIKDRGGNFIKIDFIEHLEKGYSSKFGMYQEEDDPEFYGLHPLTEYTDFAKPIILTGHWLIKLGFEELETDDNCEYFYYSKNIGNDSFLDIAFNETCPVFSLRIIYNIKREEVFYLPNNFMYVHRLQNFINCL